METQPQIPLEIERKWLLKRLPIWDAIDGDISNFDKIIAITQHYMEAIDGSMFRLRQSIVCDHSKGGLPLYEYHKTIKKELRKGVFEEDETQLIFTSYFEMLTLNKPLKVIKKTRKVKYLNGYKYEFDVYHDIALITLEIEFPTENTDIILDYAVQSVVIAEVTGIKEFSNSALAEPL